MSGYGLPYPLQFYPRPEPKGKASRTPASRQCRVTVVKNWISQAIARAILAALRQKT